MCGLRKFSSFILIFVSEGTLTVFSIVAVTIYIPNLSRGGFPCLHTPLALPACRVSGNGHSDWCDVMPCCSLDLHFSNV